MRNCFKYLVTILSVLMCIASVNAQVHSIGKVLSWKKTATGIEGKTSSAYFRIQVYNEKVIRVRVSLSEKMDDFSYSLVSAPASGTEFRISEEKNSILLQTNSLNVSIEKLPGFRVIIRNKAGTIISEDVPGDGFGTSFIGLRSSLYKKLQDGERFVGLGETLGNLDKRGNGFTLNNTDTYKYGDPRLSMYVSIPFYIGIHHQEVYGLFYHNTYKTFFNFGLSTPGITSITADGGDADYFLIYDKDIPGILTHYSNLTGRMPMPPVWSLGYHQSRCSYYPQETVQLLGENFRRKQIPIDCIVLDADYLQDYEPFRINLKRFPDMPGLTSSLLKMGIEVTASVNPGIMIDSSYFAHADGLAKDIFVKYSDGSLYTAEIAPSLNNYVDFTNPKGRTWWIDHMKFLPENGIAGYWNDMNEPAVGGSYLPDNLLFDFDGRKANALEAKNVYGMQMARSSFESAIKYGKGKRPFVLTRSGFAGVQRYAAIWTGDNTAKDEFLLSGTLLNTQMGLSGVPFVGDDIGGYIGNTSNELFIRWMQVGMFAPFARNHKMSFANSNEPWSFGDEAEAISREYIGFRYRLLPYLYSNFHEAAESGMPVARSLCISNPFDDKVYESPYQYQFLCGDALLVIPVNSEEKTKKYYLPEGEWFDIHSDAKIQGMQELTAQFPLYDLPVFVRASSMIPMQSLVQSTKEMPSDTLFLHIYNGSKSSEFAYYEDDGMTQNFRNGVYCKRKISFNPASNSLTIGEKEGSFDSKFHFIQCIFHGFDGKISRMSGNNTNASFLSGNQQILDGLRYLDDIYETADYINLRKRESMAQQYVVTFPLSEKQLLINWVQ
ncbi:MAG: glycoside hydrolase family 31 protein [Bacteroidales bacterium]|nr:glycoside hydrolase family 31 protein [Bacteroidales bacterium]